MSLDTGVTVSFEQYLRLKKVCEITGIDEKAFVAKAIDDALQPYSDGNRIDGTPAIFIKDASPAAKAAAQNEGREVGPTEVPCRILSLRDVFGKHYYKVFCDGQIITVPPEYIKFDKPKASE